jgi:hypothetical protein
VELQQIARNVPDRTIGVIRVKHHLDDMATARCSSTTNSSDAPASTTASSSAITGRAATAQPPASLYTPHECRHT